MQCMSLLQKFSSVTKRDPPPIKMTQHKRMTDVFHDVYYILMKDSLATKKERSHALHRQKHNSEVNVLKGSIWIDLQENVSLKPNSKKIELISVEYENVTLTCHRDIVKCINGSEYQLLIAIPSLCDRYDVFDDGNWLAEGMTLKISDIVYLDKGNGMVESIVGQIKYRGQLPENEGTWFGVLLSAEHEGQGNSDGSFSGKRFFTCRRNCATFTNISHIRSCRNKSLFRECYPQTATQNHVQQLAARELGDCPLRMNERVVWISDNGPEYAVVKWIGHIADSLHVGVIFDNKVGTGTGKHAGVQLFQAPPGYASLIPLSGLMKASEFDPPDSHLYDSPSPAYAMPNKVDLPVARGPGHPPPRPPPHGSSSMSTDRSGIRKASENMDYTGLPITSKRTGLNKPEYVRDGHRPTDMYNTGLTQYSPRLPGGSTSHRTHSHPVERSHHANIQHRDHGYIIRHPPSPVENAESTDMLYAGRRPTAAYQKDQLGDLEIESLVQVKDTSMYGVIRWIGTAPGKDRLIAGLELEEENSAATDGTFMGERKFTCAPKKGFFVYLSTCTKDLRFAENPKYLERTRSLAFGTLDCPEIQGKIGPPEDVKDVTHYVGKHKGIQGHHNSCYMDATLFSMFAFTQVFDIILFRPQAKTDVKEYTEVQNVLKEAIVNPLRTNFYVRADKVLKLRKLLDKLSNIQGLMDEEKDPEEFLSSLLEQIMKADPLIKFNSGNESYLYQLFIEKDERIVLPTTQQLLELSCLQSNIKLSEAPSCLILQMPRFGKDYKMYERIVPSLELDITDILERNPRNCAICGNLAWYECQQCYKSYGDGLDKIAFCEDCNVTNHRHAKRSGHKPVKLNVVPEYVQFWKEMKAAGREITIPREKMELFAVLCIQTSHYIAFVKCGRGRHAPWVFFDSMADRMGEQHGYNIPEVKACPDLTDWLSDRGMDRILECKEDRQLPEQMRRLLCDGYMCMYQNPQIMMNK